MRFQKGCCGFTLLELVIVLAVLFVLVAITISAVQAAREAARNTSCASRLRELATAVTAYESVRGVVPSNGGFSRNSLISTSSGLQSHIWTIDYSTNFEMKWGIGNPVGNDSGGQAGSWAYSVLPYVEQQNAFQQVQFSTRQHLYLCPTRIRENALPPVDDAFGSYQGGGFSWCKTDYAGNSYCFPNNPDVFRMRDCVDGLSNTIMLGEKAFDPIVQTASSWYWDEPLFSGGSKGTARRGTKLLRDGIGIEFKDNWSSGHLSGVNFVLFDSSIRFLAFETDRLVFRELLSPSSGL